MRRKRAQNRLQIVNILRQRGIGQRLRDSPGVSSETSIASCGRGGEAQATRRIRDWRGVR